MKTITLEELLEAGCHFGHQVNRRNPKADEFIFEERAGINIINLEKTREGLIAAASYLKDLSGKDGSVVIVATKKQARQIVFDAIKRAQEQNVKKLFYVTHRWVGGILTNSEEVSKNYKKLKDLRIFLQNPPEGYTKREIGLFEKEKNKLENFYAGIADMDKLPDALLIVDTHQETTAIKEALRTNVKTVGIVDTNADPDIIDYPIPANDDAVGSIKIVVDYLVDAWVEGQRTEIKDQKSNPIQSDSKIKNEEEVKKPEANGGEKEESDKEVKAKEKVEKKTEEKKVRKSKKKEEVAVETIK